MTEITDFLNSNIKALRTTDTVADAQDLFAEYPFSHFPVLENGVYIGCAGSEDTELLDIEKTMDEARYTFERFFVRFNMIWLDVLEVFAKNEASGALLFSNISWSISWVIFKNRSSRESLSIFSSISTGCN